MARGVSRISQGDQKVVRGISREDPSGVETAFSQGCHDMIIGEVESHQGSATTASDRSCSRTGRSAKRGPDGEHRAFDETFGTGHAFMASAGGEGRMS